MHKLRFRTAFLLAMAEIVCCLALVLTLALVAGCTKHNEKEEDKRINLGREDADFLIVVAIDMSGSFTKTMADDGKGWEFVSRVADKYFRDSVGTQNRLVIVQLSAEHKPAMLWDGTPTQLRQQFSTAEAFRDFLLQKSDPFGSRLYDGIADAIDYVLLDQGVVSGKTRVAVFALSDFDETTADPKKAEDRLVKSLQAFGKKNGAVGFYFLRHNNVPRWRQHLAQSGIKSWACESEIVAYPPLPSIE